MFTSCFIAPTCIFPSGQVANIYFAKIPPPNLFLQHHYVKTDTLYILRRQDQIFSLELACLSCYILRIYGLPDSLEFFYR
jgi:hypothetical protein